MITAHFLRLQQDAKLRLFDRIVEAVRQVMKWSNWGQRKTLYARNGSRFGDAVINVTTDFFSQKVRLELLHPGVVREIETGPTGFVKRRYRLARRS